MSIRFRIFLAVFGVLLIAVLPLARVPAGDVLMPPDDGGRAACSMLSDELPGCTEVLPPVKKARCVKKAVCAKTPSVLVKSRRIRLNYSISDVGPSGVSSVELWATRDGNTWQRYSNEPPPAGPLVVCVAEEGKYGFSIVVKNGLGIAGPAPRTGDTPQMWVEVDETKPAVRVTDCQVGRGHDAGTLTICWTASDANLMDRPVTISTAVSTEGPWTPVIAGLANTGKYVWQMPTDLPYEFHVRVEALDKAGNVGSDHTGKPVRVDMARPRGTILGIDEKKVETPPQAPNGSGTTDQKQLFNFMQGFIR